MSQWQDIETAPQDEPILVCGFGQKNYFVTDAKRTGCLWWMFDHYGDGYSVEVDPPTGWMPLPPPPENNNH